MKKIQLELYPIEANRAELRKEIAELRRFQKVEEDYWKQKAGMTWFKEGDKNTKFFHPHVNRRRRKLLIHKIEDAQGKVLDSNQEIGNEAVKICQEQFQESNWNQDFGELTCIPKMLIESDRESMERWSKKEEIRHVVFDLNKDSAGGPDVFSSGFYQACWDIIKEEVIQAVQAFFCGAELPRYITHTTLVLIPKKDVVRGFSDLRHISLSTFMNKMISKVIQGRVEKILHKIISPNQSGFVKGRRILENILLAQEIVRDMPNILMWWLNQTCPKAMIGCLGFS